MQNLEDLIDSGKAVVGIVGLGYVGLPLSMLMARKFKVVGYDVDESLVVDINKGKSRVEDVPQSVLGAFLGRSFFATSREEDLEACDVFIVCVPAFLLADGIPDLDAVHKASSMVGRHLRQGSLIILQTTTFPGTTDAVMVPILEEGGLKAGPDFYVAYSPERSDPGRRNIELSEIPRVVGGFDAKSTIIATRFLQRSFEKVVVVRDCRTAEAVKMLENIFRAVNIALVNELSVAFERMDIDAWEVIDAAATKPFGFMAFHPGPGIGGHCIPLDPFYFSYAAKRVGVMTRFIDLSGAVNSFMPYHVLELLVRALSRAGKQLRAARVAVLGLSYKPHISDTRGSLSVRVIEEVARRGGVVKAYDPFAAQVQTEFGVVHSAC